jgi:tetratricopeptide (TPR) repeat protein
VGGEQDRSERIEEAVRLFHEAYRKQMSQELDEAVKLYKQSLACYPTAEAHTFLGWTYSFMGRLDDAIAECHKAIETDPSFGNPYNDIGAYLMQKGKVDEAIPWFLRALEASRYESYCFPHMNLGRAYEAKRQWAAAIREFELALRERADYRPAKEGLARIRAMFN